MAIKIGNANLTYGLILAPMAGVSDRIFRRICMAHGAEYTVSEMVSAKALCYEQKSKKSNRISATAELATVLEGDMPMAIQIFGSEPDFMAEGARMLATGNYNGCVSNVIPSAIDINMGCPVRKITGNGEGSALMKNPKLAGEIATAVCKSVNIPVTVKIRAGWDAQSINAPELAKILEASGVSAICVHARTKEQLYTPGIDLGIIEKVKKAVNIPVIGNGDVVNGADAVKMLASTGCDGVMIGRGAMGNPWIFQEIKNAIDHREYISPTIQERLLTANIQLDNMIAEYGEHTGTAQAKKHICRYITGIQGSACARNRIMNSDSSEDIRQILEELL